MTPPLPKSTYFLLAHLLLLFSVSGSHATNVQSVTTSTDSIAAPIPDRASLKAKMSPLARGAAYAAAGAGIWTATYLWVDEPLQRQVVDLRSEAGTRVSSVINPLGRQKYWAPVSGAVAVGGILFKKPKLRKFGMVSLGGLIVSGTVTTFVKNKTHRYRPDRSTKNDVYDWNTPESMHTALPSAHATVSFAVATAFSTVYGNENRFASPIAYSMATVVSVARMYDNAHWATDLMAGAASGYLSSKGTAYLYDLAERKLGHRKERLIITPQASLEAGSLRATLVF